MAQARIKVEGFIEEVIEKNIYMINVCVSLPEIEQNYAGIPLIRRNIKTTCEARREWQRKAVSITGVTGISTV